MNGRMLSQPLDDIKLACTSRVKHILTFFCMSIQYYFAVDNDISNRFDLLRYKLLSYNIPLYDTVSKFKFNCFQQID